MITLQQVKDYLGITGSDQDNNLTIMKDAAEAIFEDLIGGSLTQETVTEKYSGDGTETLLLDGINPSFPNEYGTASWIKSGRGTQTLMSSADNIEVDGREVILVDTTFPCGIKNIEVKYQKGYASTPDDVKLGLLALVGQMHGSASKESISSESIGDYSVQYAGKAKAYPVQFMSCVDRYRQFF